MYHRSQLPSNFPLHPNLIWGRWQIFKIPDGVPPTGPHSATFGDYGPQMGLAEIGVIPRGKILSIPIPQIGTSLDIFEEVDINVINLSATDNLDRRISQLRIGSHVQLWHRLNHWLTNGFVLLIRVATCTPGPGITAKSIKKDIKAKVFYAVPETEDAPVDE